MNYGTCNRILRKANTNVLPANTIVLDLTQDESAILNRMKPKTRHNIRLALRKGVNVVSAGMEGLEIWYGLYTETALRNGLHLNSINYFYNMFASKTECSDKDVNVKLMIAYHEDIPLAAMFLVLSSHRATYLYGASSSKMRMPCNGGQSRSQKRTIAVNMICSASPRTATLPTRCTDCTSSRTASVVRSSTNSAAGTTPSRKRSTTTFPPPK